MAFETAHHNKQSGIETAQAAGPETVSAAMQALQPLRFDPNADVFQLTESCPVEGERLHHAFEEARLVAAMEAEGHRLEHNESRDQLYELIGEVLLGFFGRGRIARVHHADGVPPGGGGPTKFGNRTPLDIEALVVKLYQWFRYNPANKNPHWDPKRFEGVTDIEKFAVDHAADLADNNSDLVIDTVLRNINQLPSDREPIQLRRAGANRPGTYFLRTKFFRNKISVLLQHGDGRAIEQPFEFSYEDFLGRPTARQAEVRRGAEDSRVAPGQGSNRTKLRRRQRSAKRAHQAMKQQPDD